ncbi:MAG TPA: hypothetical protein VGH28_03295 [Polyangiaceae bacterium]|jgi:hypothetical protein
MHLLLVVVAALVVFLILRKRGHEVRVALSSSSPAVDRWLRESLVTVLAVRLAKKGVERAHVASALGGDPDPAVVSEIETAVKAIELEYRRDPHLSDLEVRARVRFEDGTEEDLTTRMPYAEAPASVREDFEQKHTTRAFRKWDFPWMASA